ncbi:MAG TPA: hypothetical protein VJB94_03480 [Candidatus Nanoarchaeia archaeon]|nr:hypothetical protein [Candidatus Nanoarchaeia archaeon]
MLVKVLGLVDLVAGLLIVGSWFNFTPLFGWYVALFLLIKSIIYLKEIISIMDLLAVLFLILALLNINTIFSWMFALWLIQKGFFSLVA